MNKKQTSENSAGFEADWNSLKSYQAPDWFRDAKIGIFIHWGIYSACGYGNEWYPRGMYMRVRDMLRTHQHAHLLTRRHHLRNHGNTGQFGYKDFIGHFTGDKFDPVEWLDHFENWGGRYIMPVGEHHDGFPMFDSRFTDWNAAKMGPKRDICRELAAETRKRGLKFSISTHRAWNWRYYHFHKGDDTMDPANQGLYGKPHKAGEPASPEFLEDWYGRVKEMIDEFRPDSLYFDFGWHAKEFESYRPKVAAYYYNQGLKHGYEPVLNYKNQSGFHGGSAKFPAGTAVLDIERGGVSDISEYPWQTCTSVSYQSWGFIESDTFRTPGALVHDMVDIVSKNGNLLINVGPRPDGTIPEPAIETMNAMGEWLKVNGEAIYGTRPWETFYEGKTLRTKGAFNEKPLDYKPGDYRFTCKGSTVYAIAMAVPESRLLEITSFHTHRKSVEAVSLVGHDGNLVWEDKGDRLVVQLPQELPSDYAVAIRVSTR